MEMSFSGLPARLWLPSLLLALAVPALLWPRARRVGWGLAGAGYGVAALDGRLGAPALAALALAGLITFGWRRLAVAGPAGRVWLPPLAFGLMAPVLLLHRWPGFDNARVLAPTRLTPDALPFSFHFNLDTPLLALTLFAGWAPLRAAAARPGWLAAGLGWGALTAALCLGAGVAAGALGAAPKWPAFGPAWLVAQIGGTVFVEETLFRGGLQAALARRLGPMRGLLLAALVFGLVHAAGGPLLVVLAALAGLGYGLAWQRGGLAAAMLAHLLLNLLHFGLLTYPARA
ncbi:CPBP family intramembrane glutamic endopeptidase [Derxia gummosa]|uniref:CPBP family intramembrane glutamic endopeptidase n=1 Tax=Derxia gummosa DSM 723 TaxID=1121388 RepID=A0A9U5D181_9BURK|nr:CPBP family intramembrane glutamic endopeptidase [Derxia gummosa]